MVMEKHFFRRIVGMIIIVCVIAVTARAQDEGDYRFEIGGMAGGAFYMGDVNKNTIFKGMNPAVGGVFRYTPNLRWALKTNLTWAMVSGSTEGLDNVFPNGEQASFSRSLIDVGGQMEFNFMPYSDRYVYLNAKRFAPYAFLGIGMTVAVGGQTTAALNLPIGVGVKYKLTSRLNLGCEFSVRKVFSDKLDVTDGSNAMLEDPYGITSSFLKNKDWYSFLTLSITWSFGPRCQPCNNIRNM